MGAEDAELLLRLLKLPVTVFDGLGIQMTLEVLIEVLDESCYGGMSEGYLEVDMSEDLAEIF